MIASLNSVRSLQSIHFKKVQGHLVGLGVMRSNITVGDWSHLTFFVRWSEELLHNAG